MSDQRNVSRSAAATALAGLTNGSIPKLTLRELAAQQASTESKLDKLQDLLTMLVNNSTAGGVVQDDPSPTRPAQDAAQILQAAPDAMPNVDTIVAESEEESLERKLRELRAAKTAKHSPLTDTSSVVQHDKTAVDSRLQGSPVVRKSIWDILPNADDMDNHYVTVSTGKDKDGNPTEGKRRLLKETRDDILGRLPENLKLVVTDESGKVHGALVATLKISASGTFQYHVSDPEFSVVMTEGTAEAKAYAKGGGFGGIYFGIGKVRRIK